MPGIESPQLEPELEQKILQGGLEDYSLDSCLTLLRLYSFSPDRVNVKCLSIMLLKAMLQLPSNDISLMLHMIPERLQDEQPIAALVALTQHLEGARFAQFWQAADMCRDTLKSVPGLQNGVRTVILDSYSRTCRKVPKTVLADSLRLDAAAVDELIQSRKSQGWKVVESAEGGKSLVCFPPNDFNTCNSQVAAAENLHFRLGDVAPLLAGSQVKVV